MRGVDLNGVEAGARGAAGGGREGLDRLCDPRQRHLLRDDHLRMALLHAVRNGRGRDRGHAGDIDTGVTAAMTELDGGLCPGRVDRFDEACQAGKEAVIVDAKLEVAMLPGAFGGGHLDGDEPDSALRAGAVMGEQIFRDEALRIRRAGRHRRHDQAVAECDRPDPSRFEQARHRGPLDAVYHRSLGEEDNEDLLLLADGAGMNLGGAAVEGAVGEASISGIFVSFAYFVSLLTVSRSRCHR